MHLSGHVPVIGGGVSGSVCGFSVVLMVEVVVSVVVVVLGVVFVAVEIVVGAVMIGGLFIVVVVVVVGVRSLAQVLKYLIEQIVFSLLQFCLVH